MLLETIRCDFGEALHLSYHQQRLDRSLKQLGYSTHYDLHALISPPNDTLYRCRFLYDSLQYSVEFIPYTPRSVTSLKLVYDDTIEYPLKYSDRAHLNTLYELRGVCDDVLIVKNGLLSDTTIANIALKIDNRWYTPQSPLLEGTTRARLIDEGFLLTAPLTPFDIAKSSSVAIMNAMVGFFEVENGIIRQKQV